MEFDKPFISVIKGTYNGDFCIKSSSGKFGIDAEIKVVSEIFKTIPETIKVKQGD